ncbi:MAG: glycosyltransferase family 4 protein [Pseudomonadota bacterium]
MNHYPPLVAALVTLLLTFILMFTKASKEIQDIPNERSLHTEPVPRIGGVALVAGVLSGWATMFKSLAWWVVLPLILLFVVSLLDDMRGLPVRKRLLAHLAAAAILVAGSGLLAQSLALGLLLLLLTVWMTNLYNFMDGSDGLAGGMALFGFTMYGAASLMHQEESLAMLNFAVGGAALAFLYYNFYPAKVFMGDAGSIPLGFLAAAMGLWGWQRGMWPLWFPAFVFAPFVLDATVTLIKRTLRGEKIWQAHREHYYQRTVQMGFGHKNTAVAEYVLMFGNGASALWALSHPESLTLLLVGWAVFYVLAMLVIDRLWKGRKLA